VSTRLVPVGSSNVAGAVGGLDSTRMQWWEVYVQTPVSMSDVVSDFLHRCGSTAVVIHEAALLTPQQPSCISSVPQATAWTVLQGAFPADTSLVTRVASLQAFLYAQAEIRTTPPYKLHCRPLRDTAYLTQWQQFFKPLWIGQRLCIRPPWETAPLPPQTACLTLEPGLAFGTGAHATTYLCLTLLTQWLTVASGGTLLDVGCGSGILSLAALTLGVHTAVGVDIDAQAVAVAQQNAVLNGLQHRVRYLQGSWEVTEEAFDLITANIYLEPLLGMAAPLSRRLRPHGILILSGILASQEAALQAALYHAKLEVQQRLMEEEWVALAVRHRRQV
jgi:ribosomal protein L11 methyltransferase